MNWTQISEQWERFGPELQNRWGRLTEDDLTSAREGRDKLVGCLLERYQVSPTSIERHVDDWLTSA